MAAADIVNARFRYFDVVCSIIVLETAMEQN